MNKAKNSPQPKVFSPRYLSCGGLVTGLSLLMMGTNSLMAQVDDELSDDILLLDPFEVTTNIEGYKALDTLGGSRVRTSIADTPSSLTVVTPKLMQDLGVTNAEDLLIYTTNTEVSGLGGNFSGMAQRGSGVASAGEDNRLVNPAGTNRSRGISAMDNTRNYFLSDIPWDGYNISRIDISRGPNSFLFGVGSPSGISNVSTNEAAYRDFGNVELHYGSYGSTRESFDYNEEILENELAVRIDLVNDQKQFKQKPAYNHAKRAYMALRYDPEFLDTESSHTKILFNYEYGNVNSNNPRTLPPMDYITGYFDDVNKEGVNPYTFNPDESGADPAESAWVASESIHYAFGGMPVYWFNGASGQFMQAGQSESGGQNYDGTGYVGGFGALGNGYNVYTSGFRHYAEAMNASDSSLYPGADVGTVTYLDKTLSDPTIFDFFNNLIDGPNKHEWQDWDAYNFSIVQSLFNNRLSLQAVATHEDYTRGMEGILSGYMSPYISIDMNSYLNRYPSWNDNAEVNPNVGRPFIAGEYGGGNSSTNVVHDNYQLTAAYSLRAEDLSSSSMFQRIFGHQEFTGLAGRYVTKTENRKWVMHAADQIYAFMNGESPTLTNRSLGWVSYLGDSLIGADSASNAYLSNISGSLIPVSGSVELFNSTWIAGDEIDPTAEWIYQIPGEDPAYMTQADNPANYAGYQDYDMTVISDRDQLYSSGDKSKETLESYAFMYQGFFWDEAIIPSFGWRRDKVHQQGTLAPVNSYTNVASMDYDLEDEGVRISTTSVSYGVAVHLGKIFKNLLPENDDITLFYFHGNNQTPRVRYAVNTNMLPSEEGETDDFSIQYDGFDGRVSMRLTYFKTIDKDATASYGQPLGASGWLIDSLPSWTVGFAASAIYATEHTDDELPNDLRWQSWLWQWGRDNPDVIAEIADVMMNEFSDVFTQQYWDLYNLPVDAAAIRNGDWLNVLNNGAAPLPWNINNEHLIHGTNPVMTQDVESKGFELEATVRPMPNWDITFNASRVEAKQIAFGKDTSEYLETLATLYIESPLSQIADWGNFDSPIRNQFMSGLWGPYLTQISLTGSAQPEIRKWNFKIISNYSFDEGALKGFNIGGAFRWADKPIIGYGISEGELYGETAWLCDINKPYFGSTDSHFDMWIGYQRELTEKIDWRIQLNLRNVGENSGLETIAVQPDGSVAQQRITEGMTYDLSMKFMF